MAIPVQPSAEEKSPRKDGVGLDRVARDFVGKLEQAKVVQRVKLWDAEMCAVFNSFIDASADD